MKYEIYKAVGGVEVITTEKPLSLEQLRKHVEGYIEFISDGKGKTLCVNEEGRMLNLTRNNTYPQLFGNVVKGKTKGAEFVGVDG